MKFPLAAAILLTCSEACVAWRRLVDSAELWHIATPRLRVKPNPSTLARINYVLTRVSALKAFDS